MTEPGPVSEELAKLLGAAQEWLHRTVLDPSTARISTGGEECCWCPLCQLLAAVRSERPELTERWGDVQTAIVNLLRAAAESATPSRPGPQVHRIDLSTADTPEGA